MPRCEAFCSIILHYLTSHNRSDAVHSKCSTAMGGVHSATAHQLRTEYCPVSALNLQGTSWRGHAVPEHLSRCRARPKGATLLADIGLNRGINKSFNTKDHPGLDPRTFLSTTAASDCSHRSTHALNPERASCSWRASFSPIVRVRSTWFRHLLGKSNMLVVWRMS